MRAQRDSVEGKTISSIVRLEGASRWTDLHQSRGTGQCSFLGGRGEGAGSWLRRSVEKKGG